MGQDLGDLTTARGRQYSGYVGGGLFETLEDCGTGSGIGIQGAYAAYAPPVTRENVDQLWWL